MREVKIKLVRLVRQCQELVKFGEGAGQREAFVSLCDLLMAFAKQLRRVGQLGPLVYTSDPALQEAMQEFILNQVHVYCSMFTESSIHISRVNQLTIC